MCLLKRVVIMVAVGVGKKKIMGNLVCF